MVNNCIMLFQLENWLILNWNMAYANVELVNWLIWGVGWGSGAMIFKHGLFVASHMSDYWLTANDQFCSFIMETISYN